MPFPINPSSTNDPRQFLIQDPFGVRHPIISLLSIDSRTHHVSGLGTAFRVDPFGQYFTAQHVLEAWLGPARPHTTVVGLLNPGLVYGLGPIGNDRFVTIATSTVFRTEPGDAVLDELLSRNSSRMTLDCMTLHFEENPRLNDVRAFLPLRLTGKWPKIGDAVMATEFPELGFLKDRPIADDVLTEHMRGYIGQVSGVFPHGREHRPWPTFSVDELWPSGMSGGPVFNQDGEVIGLVSSSDQPGSDNAQSYAFWLSPIPFLPRYLPHSDPSNPGWVHGWSVVRSAPWHLGALTPDRSRAETICSTLGTGYEVRFGSSRAGSDDFVSVSETSNQPKL
jgi:serine protease Do